MSSNLKNDFIGSEEGWGHWRVVSCPDWFSFGFNSNSSQIDFGFQDFLIVVFLWPASVVSVGSNFSLRNHSQVDSWVVRFWEWIQGPALWHEELNEEFSFSDFLLGDWGSHLNFDLLIVVSKDVSSKDVEGFITSIIVSSLDDGFSDDPRLIVSDLEFSNCFFNSILRTVVVGNEERAEDDKKIGEHVKKCLYSKQGVRSDKKVNFLFKKEFRLITFLIGCDK